MKRTIALVFLSIVQTARSLSRDEGARYIVQWNDYHPSEEHASLLRQALGDVIADDPATGDNSSGDHNLHGCGGTAIKECNGIIYPAKSFRDHLSEEGWVDVTVDSVERKESASLTERSPPTHRAEYARADEQQSKKGSVPSDAVCWAILERRNLVTKKISSDFTVVAFRIQEVMTTHEHCWPYDDCCHCDKTCGSEMGEGRCGGTDAFDEVLNGEGRLAEGAARRAADRRVECVCGDGVGMNDEVENVLASLRSSSLVKHVRRDQVLRRLSSPAPTVDECDDAAVQTDASSGQTQTVNTRYDWTTNPALSAPKRGPRSADNSGDATAYFDGGTRTTHGHSGGSNVAGAGYGSLRGSPRKFVDASRQASWLHERGYLGSGIRVAVFDTGLDAGGHDFENVVERVNWTSEDTLEDAVGHGTHVAGVIAGRDAKCMGFAPEAELYISRVFSSHQVSYTSWFLDAFNYALFLGVDIVNLSIGGPDFNDQPFVEKVRELSANGILVVSAVGNDGPLYGTHHNPADQADTIGVGALNPGGSGVVSFQSRGMTTWELPDGYGRVKPDILAVGQNVLGPKAGGANGECSVLSGTSVASPVVAGAAALLASTVPADRRADIVNPASIKQVMVESALSVSEAGIFEQGAGRLDVLGAFQLLSEYKPRASLLPPALDLTDPYMWPYNRQPLYYGARPTVFNVTIANGMGVTGEIRSVVYKRGDPDADILDIKTEFSHVVWPWSGYIAISVSVSPGGRGFEGVVTGEVEVVVESQAGPGESQLRSTTMRLPITVKVIETPPREKRLLWDQFHSIPYPSAYSPRDNLSDDSDMLDRHGDHPHTNFRSLFNSLIDAGYYLEVLGSDWSCFDAYDYGALLMVDLEDEMGEREKRKLESDVKEKGLSLVILADWYSQDLMSQVRFVDDNTRTRWEPVTGGSNVPALNDFLFRAFGMALGGEVLDGEISLSERRIHFASGNAIARMPPEGLMVFADSLGGAVVPMGDGELPSPVTIRRDVAVIGMLDTDSLGLRKSSIPDSTLRRMYRDGGRIFLFGDSSCADDASLQLPHNGDDHDGLNCLWLVLSAVRYASEGHKDEMLFSDAKEVSSRWYPHSSPGYSDGQPLPTRTATKELFKYSKVMGHEDAGQSQCTARKWLNVPAFDSKNAAR